MNRRPRERQERRIALLPCVSVCLLPACLQQKKKARGSAGEKRQKPGGRSDRLAARANHHASSPACSCDSDIALFFSFSSGGDRLGDIAGLSSAFAARRRRLMRRFGSLPLFVHPPPTSTNPNPRRHLGPGKRPAAPREKGEGEKESQESVSLTPVTRPRLLFVTWGAEGASAFSTHSQEYCFCAVKDVAAGDYKVVE